MKRTMGILAAAVALAATACNQDYDFTADHKADYVVVEANGTWRNAANDTTLYAGSPDDWAAPGDWNGDNVWDVAVVRPNGDWVTQAAGTFSFPKPIVDPGAGGPRLVALPVPGDYDGDGTTDAAWYDESTGVWHIRGQEPVDFGDGQSAPSEADYDFPVPADYDGDGTTDLSVFNPATQVWRVRESATGTVTSVAMPGNEGLPMPVPADYDGVGHAERAVYGPHGWIIEGHASPDPFGTSPSAGAAGYPAVADYDGDDRADLAIVEWDSRIWRTKGSMFVVTLTGGATPMIPMPLTTNPNLRQNMARLTFQGRCNTNPGWC